MFKVLGGAGVGGALAVVLCWSLRQKFGLAIPEDVQTAFASIFSASFACADKLAECIRNRNCNTTEPTQ